jgi:hypothetical protein
MTLIRLVLASLLLCSLSAFSQDQIINTAQMPGNEISSYVANRDAAVTPSEPWKIIPNRSSDLSMDSADHIRVDQFRLDQGQVELRTGKSKLEAKTRTLIMGLDGRMDDDATCYTMRSYVVARDSKNSDSTHPTGYSTCQPASKYRVRTTQQGGPAVQNR